MKTPPALYPSLREALAVWQECLARHQLPVESRWIFAENICIERSRPHPGSLHVGFQTQFTQPDDDSLNLAYDHFHETNARIVFYRLGSAGGKSVCLLLCDEWFEEKSASEGYERRDPWKISFRPGHAGDIEEITDLPRWVRRVRHDRAFHDFDFSMSLATLDEIRFHGEPLHPYQRMAQGMMRRLRRVLGEGD